MKLTKELIGKNWAVTWDRASPPTANLMRKLWKLAFAKCEVFSEVGIGYTFEPDVITYHRSEAREFIQWFSYMAWAQMDETAQEQCMSIVSRGLPPGAHINTVMFRRELEADIFKDEIEKRISWKILGGEAY